jgi:putative transposase
MKRNVQFTAGQFYHVYNKGIEGKAIFLDEDNIRRFFESLKEFNAVDAGGGLYQVALNQKKVERGTPVRTKLEPDKLVHIVAYALAPDHFHLLVEQVVPHGVERFMQKLGNGYTKYFNKQAARRGSLFEGPYKIFHVKDKSELPLLSAYINMNDKIHRLDTLDPLPLGKTSWLEYLGRGGARALGGSDFCEKGAVLGQFENLLDYKKFVEERLEGFLQGQEALWAEVKPFILESRPQ